MFIFFATLLLVLTFTGVIVVSKRFKDLVETPYYLDEKDRKRFHLYGAIFWCLFPIFVALFSSLVGIYYLVVDLTDTVLELSSFLLEVLSSEKITESVKEP